MGPKSNITLVYRHVWYVQYVNMQDSISKWMLSPRELNSFADGVETSKWQGEWKDLVRSV